MGVSVNFRSHMYSLAGLVSVLFIWYDKISGERERDNNMNTAHWVMFKLCNILFVIYYFTVRKCKLGCYSLPLK